MASDERVLIPLPGTPGFEASVPLERLRKSLSTQGLHIVTDADMRVLDAAQRWHVLDTSVNTEALHHYAELARREALKDSE